MQYPDAPGVHASLEEASETDKGTKTLGKMHQGGQDSELNCSR